MKAGHQSFTVYHFLNPLNSFFCGVGLGALEQASYSQIKILFDLAVTMTIRGIQKCQFEKLQLPTFKNQSHSKSPKVCSPSFYKGQTVALTKGDRQGPKI